MRRRSAVPGFLAVACACLLAAPAFPAAGAATAAAAAAADPGPRAGVSADEEFELRIAEGLGDEIWLQDQAAWQATDAAQADADARAAMAAVGRDGAGSGWISERIDDDPMHWRVSFLRDTPAGAAAFVVVELTFGEDARDPVVRVLAEPKVLTGTGLALDEANALAHARATTRCKPNYNYALLAVDVNMVKSIRAYLLPAWNDDRYPLGGYHRIDVTDDGRGFLGHDDSLAACATVSLRAAGERPLWVRRETALPTPVDVFIGRTLRRALFVETADGRSWRVERGEIALVAAVPDDVVRAEAAGFPDEVRRQDVGKQDPAKGKRQ